MFDYALARTLAHLSKISDVTPAFAFFDESDEKNAFATEAPMLKSAEGTILFGKKMTAHLFREFQEEKGAAVTSICAHEFGHIVAYNKGVSKVIFSNTERPYRSEQFADFFAGWYAGERKRLESDYPALVFSRTLSSLAGLSRGTHGTSTDRTLAIVEGFKLAEKKLPFSEVLDEGVRFALAQPES